MAKSGNFGSNCPTDIYRGILSVKAIFGVRARRRIRSESRSKHKAVPGAADNFFEYSFSLRNCFCRSDFVYRHSGSPHFAYHAENTEAARHDSGYIFMRRGILYDMRPYRTHNICAHGAFGRHYYKHNRRAHRYLAGDFKEERT